MSEAVPVQGSDVPKRVRGIVQAVVDDDIVVLSPKDFTYFGMDGTGADVWDCIDGQRTVDEIVAGLQEAFDGEPGVIRDETISYLDVLIAAGLVEV